MLIIDILCIIEIGIIMFTCINTDNELSFHGNQINQFMSF